ncbi:hybrid sensor histidine kinase/response regulator transcription factor [Dyadobacter bucti]|uniref:hybrid sensor histidine kinase/response regulator transcription factor n=1 Tax=Dyadobacter bucti TaxID=2572203 RepID=UPI001108F4EF|nr:hybrid sensor histidine kinase/response regulator transcription factor [Dyadobacter bucti]
MRIGLVILLCCAPLHPLFALTQNIRFSQIGVNEGLSQGSVRFVFQDSKGFIWFGTKDGLSKYDGYKVTVYKKEIKNSNSLSSNDIKCISEDREGKLWIATWEGGVNVFDPKLQRFTNYRKGSPGPLHLSSDYIECIFVDSDNNVWVGTAADGLDYFDRKQNRFIHFSHDRVNSRSLTDNGISTIYEDSEKNIWIGTVNGLNRFDKKTKSFGRYSHGPGTGKPGFYNSIKFIFEDSRKNLWLGSYGGGLNLLDRKSGSWVSFKNNELGNVSLMSMAEDDHGILWIGTENNGLVRYNPLDESFKRFWANENDKTGISSNTINSVLKDADGNIWLGTQNGGANLLTPGADKFNHYRHQQGVNSLSHNIVNVIFEDSDNMLWIGTDGGGLDRFDRNKQHFTNYRNQKNNAASISGDYVLAIAEDEKHNLWLGTWGKGLTVFNPAENRYRHFRNNPADPRSVNSNYAFAIFRDSRNRLWVGTYGEGLDLYDPATDSFTHTLNDPKNPASLSSNYILNIREARNGNLLIGTEGGGLNIMDVQTGKFRTYKHSDATNSLSNNGVSSVWEDKKGNIWIGTNYGLNMLDPKTGLFRHWFTENGLPNDIITSLQPDGDGNLWINTTKGISKYNLAKDTFENFGIADGLQGNEFKDARCLSRDGRMYLGGYNGFNEFYPKDTRASLEEQSIVFTGFQIFNKEVPVSREGALKESINSVREILLSYAESVITFEFAALNFTNRDKIQYAYMLKGFDPQWSRIGSKNNVTYTNLDPGDYTLRVKTVSDKGNLSEKEASIKITVLPPYWKTWWFRLLVVLLVAGIILFIFYQRINSVKEQNRQLEEVVARRTHELKEANHDLEISNRTKDRFFSILAHDLKNPIAALSGISDLLKAKFPTLSSDEVYGYISDINKSSNSVQDLLMNLLDWARTQSQNIAYTPENISIEELLIKNQSLMEQQLKRKNIRFLLSSDPSHSIYADPQMVDTIIRNLLSNSIKFTPTEGEISVSSREEGNMIAIEISDTGIGMTTEQADSLYDIKNQRIANGTEGETGTGLGLVIVKEFMDANNGTVEVASTPSRGTTFTISLPRSRAAEIKRTHMQIGSTENKINTSQSEPFSEEKLAVLKGKKILIIDDNPEIRGFLRLLLSGTFKVFEARNGAEGVEIASVSQPDVIISDMIMPVMNGLEFCAIIKNEPRTNHIPVILLTSQANESSQLSGYEAGADSYLMKPIRQHLLFQVIYNFIRNQETIRQKFEQSEDIYPPDLEHNKPDKEFLDSIIAFIEENLTDPDLDHKKISELTNLSRTVLYAKFKSLTGQGVHDFIKSVRLKKGLKLLQEGRLNVNQIAFEVGFNTPSYFSKSFIKQYGVSPSEYVAKLKSKTANAQA